MTYRNPVWPGYLADPFVLRVGREYFAYGTGGPEDHGKQADGRMFPLLRSDDLVHWEHQGGAFIPPADAAGPAYWAPEVADKDGRYYLYFSCGGLEGEGHKIRAAVSESPNGPFEAVGGPLMPDEPFSIDPSPFRDPKTGRWYLYFAKDFFDDGRAGTGTAVVELAEDMLSVKGEVRTVIRASADWHVFERGRHWYGRTWDAWHTVEGPFVLERRSRYYCLYSGGLWESDDYGVGFGVADHPLGPWTDDWAEHGPTVLRGTDQALGPGHCSVTLGPDDSTQFVVYHAWDRDRTARRMCIDPLVWTEDGPRCDGPSSELKEIQIHG